MDAYRDQYAKLFGRQDVVLLAISTDPADVLASWAAERDYPFTFLSDSGGEVGRRYGAFSAKYGVDNRTLFVVGPDGKIAWRQAPFREVDAAAYRDLGAAVARIAGAR